MDSSICSFPKVETFYHFSCFYTLCKFRFYTYWLLFSLVPQPQQLQIQGCSSGGFHVALFSGKTTGLASIGSACWSNILSAKVTLWFSKGKGKKIQGKWNATLWCKRLALKIIKDASRFRRSLISEPMNGGQTVHKPLDMIKAILWVFDLCIFLRRRGRLPPAP